MSGRIKKQLHQQLNLSESQIILNATHTHSGPVLPDALVDIYPLDDVEKEKIAKYGAFFEAQIVNIAIEAFQKTAPVRIFAGNGVARFQVNRRNNDVRRLEEQTELKGPNDHAVPTLKIVGSSDIPIALVFGYACHPTTLSGYMWSGDYSGFAQIELEKKYPGAVAMFFQGAGADQNALPRSVISQANQYGKTLSAAVEQVLEEPMRLLPAVLSTAYTEIDLPLTPAPSIVEMEKIIAATTLSYHKRWAERFLSELKAGKAAVTSYPYPLQVWNMGGLPIISLGGELVVEYAIGLKKLYGYDTFVMGYCNDVMAYIPSVTILNEGGYEGDTSQQVYGLPSKWKPEIESLIYEGLEKLTKQAGILTQVK
jgi:hypothetical protein